MNIEHFYDAMMQRRYIRKLEKQKRQFNIGITLLYFVLAAFSLLYTQYWFLYSGTPIMDYSRLNNSEEIYVKQILSEVNPIYLEHTRKIIFTRDILSINGNTFQKIEEGEPITFGTNTKFQRVIHVYVTGVYEDDKNILCHELLHSVLYIGDEEPFAYDLSDKGVCYGK